MSLTLSSSDSQVIKRSWTELQNNNKYHKDEFVSRLFGNLLAANPNLKSVLSTDLIIRQQSKMFNDMLGFTIMYLDNEPLLEECMNEFVQENPSIVALGVQYLEPMGLALIQTFRQWLGSAKFHAGLETLWIKIYVFLANCILQHDDSTSDVSSILSDHQRSSETEEEEEFEPIQPLKPVKEATPPPPEKDEPQPVQQPVHEIPATPSKSSIPQSISANTLHIELSSNEKYRGFRRSMQPNSNPVPIEVKIPEPFAKPNKLTVDTTTFITSLSAPATPSEPFDPRRLRRGSASPVSMKNDEVDEVDEVSINSPSKPWVDEDDSIPIRKRPTSSIEFNEPVLTPRSSRRNSAAEIKAALDRDLNVTPVQTPTKTKFNNKQSKVINDSDSEGESDDEPEKSFGFDPRRKHSRNSSVHSASTFQKPVSEVTTGGNASSEDSVSDVEDDFNLNNDDLNSTDEDVMDFTQAEPKTINIPNLNPKQVFDSNSFGIQALAPIVEDSDDGSSKYDSSGEEDNASSNYEESNSNIDKSENDEISSSGASSLSLHNSDYKSSISSGTDSAMNSPFMNNFKMGHNARQPSQSSEISYMKPLSTATSTKNPIINHKFSQSSPSLSRPYQQRASLGFMRSSFVLKKELEELGYNKPENVLMKPPTIPAAVNNGAVSAPVSKQASYASLTTANTGSDDGCFDLINTFDSPKINLDSTSIYKNQNIGTSTRRTSKKINNDTKQKSLATKEKKSFKQRLSSFFSSSSTSVVSPNEKTKDLKTTQSSSVAKKNEVVSSENKTSFAATSYDKTNAGAVPSIKAPSRKSSRPRYPRSYAMSQSDMVSIQTTETNHSSISGFSFMKKRRSSVDARSKYNVQKVPYKIF